MPQFEYKTFEDISDNYLNYLGIDGWELCGIKNYDKSTKFYFKRQLQEEPKDNITILCGTRIAEAFDKENSHIQRVILDVCRPTANRQMLDYTKSTLADLVMYRSKEDFWRTNGCGRKTFSAILDVLKRYGHIL